MRHYPLGNPASVCQRVNANWQGYEKGNGKRKMDNWAVNTFIRSDVLRHLILLSFPSEFPHASDLVLSR